MSVKKKIFYRIFPTEKLHFDYIKIDKESNKIYVRHLQELSKNCLKKEASYWEFESDGIFFNASQQEIYNKVVTDLIDNVIKGHHGIIITFGQTGSGKSFTAEGLHLSEEEFGIAPRLVNDLLNLKRNQPRNIRMCLQMSYVELNNTYAVDLLKNLPNYLEIYKSREAEKVKISSEYDALKYLFLGEGRKTFAGNNPEYPSNVCTSVVTFHITTKNMDLTEPTKSCSRIHLIDLVGNDSCGNISGSPKNPKEIGSANVTKSQLEQYILCLSENIPEKIRTKQRTNVLLYYLDGDFSRENIFRLIGHIKASTSDILVTLSVLRFGQTFQGLKPQKKQIKFDMNEQVELEYLKKQIAMYEKEKHLNSVLLNKDLVSGLNQSRIDHLTNLVQDYLRDDVQEISVMNVADTQMVLKNLKDICNNCKSEVSRLQTENRMLLAQHHSSEISLKNRSSKTSSQGSGVKISRKSSKIKSKDSISKEKVTSASTVSDKKVTDDNTAPSMNVPYTKRKKSRSGSSTAMKTVKDMKGSAQSKKKSSKTSVNRPDSKSSIKSVQDICLPIPDVVPEKQEIWKQYINQNSYRDRVDEYKKNEKEVRNHFAAYVMEIEKLRTSKDAVNKCKNDLIAAQTFRKFNSKDEFDSEGFLIVSYAEKQCKNNLEKEEKFLIQQQEKVLKAQEELKFFLGNRHTIINMIEEEFDQFSRDNFKIPSSTSQEMVQELEEYTFNINLNNPEECLEEVQELVEVPGISEKTQMIKKFQKLMTEEMKKRIHIMLNQQHKWRNV